MSRRETEVERQKGTDRQTHRCKDRKGQRQRKVEVDTERGTERQRQRVTERTGREPDRRTDRDIKNVDDLPKFSIDWTSNCRPTRFMA